MRTSFFACLLLCFSGQVFAQSDSSSVSKRQPKYFNSFLAGGLLGKSEQGSGLTASMTHGIRIKRLAIGVGLGLDSYLNWQALPVFASISFDIGKIKENAFFIQFNAGHSYVRDISKNEDWQPIYDVSGGKVINTMMGYRITAKQFSLYIAAGHKFQQVNYSYNPTPWDSSFGSKISIEENMNRFAIQIGFGFH